tara:strand:+ start:140 stop:295 length:156 start_codon:yes stop_codon:yes gene_type:complete
MHWSICSGRTWEIDFGNAPEFLESQFLLVYFKIESARQSAPNFEAIIVQTM